jgi:pyroglutamyl-peptidase
MRILITGFGPFPGAPFNPTEPLVMELARRRHPANVRRVVHVFRVTYETIDRELPLLLARVQPDALIMFGLAGRTRHIRIETRARNAITRTVPDAGGKLPVTQKLVMAARATGVPAASSCDAGRYLCNYLCWRAAEAAGAPRLVAFIHVPRVFERNRRRVRLKVPSGRHSLMTLDDLTEAGEAIVRAAIATLRSPGLVTGH